MTFLLIFFFLPVAYLIVPIYAISYAFFQIDPQFFNSFIIQKAQYKLLLVFHQVDFGSMTTTSAAVWEDERMMISDGIDTLTYWLLSEWEGGGIC